MSWPCLPVHWSVLTWLRRGHRIRISFIKISYSMVNGFSLLLLGMSVSRVSAACLCQYILYWWHPVEALTFSLHLFKHYFIHSSCSVHYWVGLGGLYSRVNKLDCTGVQMNCHSGACLKQKLQWEFPEYGVVCTKDTTSTAPLNLHIAYLIRINVNKYSGTLNNHVMLF